MVLIDGPVNMENVPVLRHQVTCTGSEQYLNECSHDLIPPPAGGCSRAAVSCRKFSSELTIIGVNNNVYC